MLISLVTLAIWLALRGAIYSRIAPFLALNRIFFSANENGIMRQKNQSDFKVSLTNKISGKWKTKSQGVANFATTGYQLSFLFQNNWHWVPSGWRLSSQEVPNIQCPFWRIFWRFFFNICSRSVSDQVQENTNENHTTTIAIKVHVSRFPVVSNKAVQELNSVPVNKNT